MNASNKRGIDLRRDSLSHKVFSFQTLGQPYIDFMCLRTDLKCPALSSIPKETCSKRQFITSMRTDC
jgi:hypothetical protein